MNETMTLRERIEESVMTGKRWSEGPYRLWDPDVLLKQAAIASWLNQEVVMIYGKLWFVPTEERAYFQQSAWQPV